MARTVLIDTGPIVAALRARDQHHGWARSQFESLTEPCLTCEAVISESFFLLGSAPQSKERLVQILERGIVRVEFNFQSSRAETLRLVQRYGDTPMSFADACMVRMSEMLRDSVVFTTDSDFLNYRRYGRQIIPLLSPW